jgi:predicted DNA-binding antitoxin AbrB/MazE fold protein
MQAYEGIYENGVVRFPAPIALPEHTKVKVVADTEERAPSHLGCPGDELHEILSRRYNTGETDLAARVDELDP